MKLRPVILLVMLLTPVHNQEIQSVAPTEAAVWGFGALADAAELQLKGYRPKVTLEFAVPAGWSFAAPGELELYYRLSEAVTDLATLTVALNGEAIGLEAFSASSGSLIFPVPAERLHPGSNTLTLQAFLPLSGDARCLRPDAPERWLEVTPASELRLPAAASQEPLELTDFPLAFKPLGTDLDYFTTFVVPKAPNGTELRTLAGVAFTLGQESHPWRVVSAGDFDPEAVRGPVVLLGSAGRANLPEEVPESGVGRPGWAGGYPVLYAADGVEDVLLKAVGGWAASPSSEIKTPKDFPKTFTLGTYGYDERIVVGTDTQSLHYTFKLPYSLSPQDGQLSLRFNHSRLLDPITSGLVVALNNQLVTRIPIGGPESRSATAEIPLARALFRPGTNDLKFTFDFSTPPEQCGVADPGGFWGGIDSATSLTIPHGRAGGRLELEDFPFSLTSEQDAENLVIVLPQPVTPEDLEDALTIVRALALAGASLPPHLVQAGNVTNELLGSHLIVLGDALRQPLLAQLNPYLPTRFDLEGSALPTFGLELPDTDPVGVLELLRSPWNRNHMVLVASGTTPSAYHAATSALSDPALRTSLSGQLAFVTLNPLVNSVLVSYRLPNVVALPVLGPASLFLERTFRGNLWPLVIVPLLGLALLGAVLEVLLRWLQVRNSAKQGGH